MVLDDLRTRIADAASNLRLLIEGMGDERVPLHAKIVAMLSMGYGVSPIDLVPDVLLGLGLLDDVLVVPTGLALAVRLIPEDVRKQLRKEIAETRRRRLKIAAAVLAVVVAAVLLWWFLVR